MNWHKIREIEHTPVHRGRGYLHHPGRHPFTQTPPPGRHSLGRHPPPGRIPPPSRHTWDTTGYGQQAGGTHPTGMHSCFNSKLLNAKSSIKVDCICPAVECSIKPGSSRALNVLFTITTYGNFSEKIDKTKVDYNGQTSVYYKCILPG